MAIHWVGIDKEALEVPKSGTSFDKSNSADLAITWESTDVSKRDKILDKVYAIKEYMSTQFNDDGGSTQLNSRGFSIALDGDVNSVTYTANSSDSSSVLNDAGTGSVAIEYTNSVDGNKIGFYLYRQRDLIDQLIQAFMETDVPLA